MGHWCGTVQPTHQTRRPACWCGDAVGQAVVQIAAWGKATSHVGTANARGSGHGRSRWSR